MVQLLNISLILCSVFILAYSVRISPPRTVSVSLINPKNTSKDVEYDGDRIVGGMQAERNEFPWIVTISFSDGSADYFCGGYIIGASWVLTAAHCCNSDSSTYMISAGVHDLTDETGTQPRYATQVIPHPKYSSQTMYNDICLIKVAGAFDFTGVNVKPIGLATPKFRTDGVECTVSGWGLTSGSASGQPKILRKVAITGIPNADCQLYVFKGFEDEDNATSTSEELPRRGYTLAASQICSGGSGKSSCYGDSGGPYMCSSPSGNMLGVGVVSGGASCGGEGIYSRVSSFLDWIFQLTGIGSGAL